MDTPSSIALQNEPPSAPAAEPPPAAAPAAEPPEWRAYVHLYLPLLTSVLVYLLIRPPPPGLESGERIASAPPLLVSFPAALVTHMAASLVYPRERPPDAAPQRFSRKSDTYRAAILLTYGRLFGTPFRLAFYLVDLVSSYVLSAVMGERPAGTRQRRSEFFVHLLLVAAGRVATMFVSPAWPTVWNVVLGVDRTLWRAAYIALVDDVVGVLTRPQVKSWKGRGVVVLVQAFTIMVCSTLLLLHLGDQPAVQGPGREARWSALLSDEEMRVARTGQF
ncbi:hypothetical protein BDV95DRAFT_609462 [Massariosphaeria phaeospora]|uniref:Uncharacterized protein n=1 Tax=Massariosphaeria phaeospora TaxID=100035 RepID=A0A7C8M727_9PLEO|nr:hypothetical protein BDV95DRAFT_609462 [Massariosphaeria phaeospora]